MTDRYATPMAAPTAADKKFVATFRCESNWRVERIEGSKRLVKE